MKLANDFFFFSAFLLSIVGERLCVGTADADCSGCSQGAHGWHGFEGVEKGIVYVGAQRECPQLHEMVARLVLITSAQVVIFCVQMFHVFRVEQ